MRQAVLLSITLTLVMLCACMAAFGQASAGDPETQPAVQSIFKVVLTPNIRAFPYHSDLTAISASSSDDIWAVGQSGIHFDGQQWTALALPLIVGDATSELTGVADLAPNNVWGVGNINIDAQNPSQVIEHFDGTEWSVSTGPVFQPTDQTALYGVSATSATDVWAAGNILTLINDEPALFPVFEHFDGTSWTAITDESTSDGGMFGISALATDDVWAVGSIAVGATLVEHFNGVKWSVIPSPNPGKGETLLEGVTALGRDDVWAVGWFVEAAGQDRPAKTLLEHWDGTSWTVVPSPNVGGPTTQAFSNELRGITAVSANDIWAFGSTDALGPERITNLVMHWDGTDWKIAPTPNPNPRNVSLIDDGIEGGIVIPPGNIWLAGVADGFGTMVLNAALPQ
jgi:hypothetical protein